MSPTAFAALAQDLSQFRGLALKRNIVLSHFKTDIGQPPTYGPYEVQRVEEAYRSIGLLPNDSDLGHALPEFRRLEQLAIYDAVNGSVMLSPHAELLGEAFESTDPAFAREAPARFAILAALQDQHFNSQDKLKRILFDDQRLAYRALTLGDAALTLVAGSREKSNRNPSSGEWVTAAKLGTVLEKAAAHLPDFLRQQVIFPYREGSQFVFWARTAQGWPGVNGLYAAPPLSTAQIIHPEKYFISPTAPLRFFPAALLGHFKESPSVEQSLGEHLVRTLLATELPARLAAAIAIAWRGDQMLSFHDNGPLATAWFSAWTSEKTAAEFARAYRTVLEKRQRVRFDSTTAPAANSFTGTIRDGRRVSLQNRGTIVLLLSGVSASRSKQLAEEAWRDLEVQADPTEVRFDLGTRRNDTHAHQLSLSSK